MKSITSKKGECIYGLENDNEVYLAWNDMKWELFGNVEEYNVSSSELCKEYDGLTNVFLPGSSLQEFQPSL